MAVTTDNKESDNLTKTLPNPALLSVPTETDINSSRVVAPTLAWRSGNRPTFPIRQRRNSTPSSQESTHPLSQQRDRVRTPRASSRPVESTTTSLSVPKIRAPRSTSESNVSPFDRITTRRRSAISLHGDNESNCSSRASSPGLSTALKAGTWWREGPMPRHLRDHLEHRHVADPRSLSGGCMVWVPSKEIVGIDLFCIREGHPCGGEVLNETGFDHPAVILGVYREENSDIGDGELYCTVAQMRTFKRTSHLTYTSGIGQQFRESVPIRYIEPMFPLGKLGPEVEQLDLLRGELFNQTYIQLQHIFKVPASKIMVFHFGSRLATDVKLTDESYVRLMHLFGYTEEMVDGVVPAFGPSPPANSRMHGYYGSNFPKVRVEEESNEFEWC